MAPIDRGIVALYLVFALGVGTLILLSWMAALPHLGAAILAEVVIARSFSILERLAG